MEKIIKNSKSIIIILMRLKIF